MSWNSFHESHLDVEPRDESNGTPERERERRDENGATEESDRFRIAWRRRRKPDRDEFAEPLLGEKEAATQTSDRPRLETGNWRRRTGPADQPSRHTRMEPTPSAP